MPFYDANTSSPSASSTASSTTDAIQPSMRGSAGNANGCCIPNLYVNVSPRFNQQLLSTEPRGNGSQQQQQQPQTGIYSSQPPSNAPQNGGANTTGMQQQHSSEECCDEEDDEDLEFYINDRHKRKHRTLNNRFVALALPTTPRKHRTEFL
jgi:hypothetical protein